MQRHLHPFLAIPRSTSVSLLVRLTRERVALSVIGIACLAALLCSSVSAFAEGCPTGGELLPGGSTSTDLVINTTCRVVGLSGGVGVYVFHNVNIIAGGSLEFEDTRIDFHAESIIVESGGKLVAGTVSHPIGTNPPLNGEIGARLRIYLWGKAADPGAECNQEVCGVPHAEGQDLWGSNTTLAMHMVPNPKNGTCTPASQINQTYKLPGDDCFYQYDTLDAADKSNAAYFGHKVLALSYGGTLQLFGTKGATYDTEADEDPASTGTSWVRLAGITTDRKTLTLSVPVPSWRAGDHIVVTTTDYMPSHNEEAVIASINGNELTLMDALTYQHNAKAYALPKMPATIGPRDTKTVETRAAVGLLTRSIEVVSEGEKPITDTSDKIDHFPPDKDNYFGGHTIVRQGFTLYQVKGVEFYRLGEGGIIGHYAVHFHMARKTPQETDTAKMSYLRDSSIHESMTRWVTIHATQGMTIARNVGYLSIGHGYYLEDATEVNNKIYANLGAGVIAAVHSDTLNPRDVPGILARPKDGPVGDFMPFRSDWNHPSAFWIMNGWNDFQYNMAAGVTSCGACYWQVPGADSGPSMFEVWDGYASQQLNLSDGSRLRMNNVGRGGLSPLQNFVGNSCVAAMFSYITVGSTVPCLGFSDGALGDTTLQAVSNPNAPAYDPNSPGYNVYYPQMTDLRNPSVCPDESKDCSTAAPCANTGPDHGKNCAVTVLDHYTSSFNFAPTNFAAIWMRAKWFLFTDGAVTDSQYGGLNFTTGGGYTRADSPMGNWMLAYRSVFIGTSQIVKPQIGSPINPFASEGGPFNPKTYGCSNTRDYGYCLSTKDGISISVGPFPGQRMFSVYDGPAFQQSNAYLDVYPTDVSDAKWMYRDRHEDGVPKDSSGTCYLPNAAIAWKQPNGFYYPPAFHSQNLMFQNANIRHFLIEPIFNNPSGITKRYCPGNDSPSMFNNFTDIDRQTVLNDGVPDIGKIAGGDGSLTGLIAFEKTPKPTTGRETISVNEDPFFNAPVEEVECASDKHPTDTNGKGAPGTAKTSPYEYVTTGLIAKCAIGYYEAACPPPNQEAKCLYPNECQQGGLSYWTHQGATPETFGVPLYRELLTDAEDLQTPRPKPFIQMMGQDSGQRSSLTLNHGHFYIDTSNNCKAQGGCFPQQRNARGVSVFQGGQTYYVYFVYGRASTQLTFDIYIGAIQEGDSWTVNAVRGIFNDDTYKFSTEDSRPAWLGEPSYDSSTGLLTETVDLSKSGIAKETTDEFDDNCQPATYCQAKTVDSKKICGCKPETSCTDSTACSWGPKDPDCPLDGCYGFAFTMPQHWSPPANPVPAPTPGKFSDDSYFATTNVNFKAIDTSKFGQDSQCQYPSRQ
jgi:hypothetical protein